ncbi:MAG: HAD family hydrolase [Phycisphaerales bacterium]|nr:HAD family hydrolase [Phycisphaerales bacterium]
MSRAGDGSTPREAAFFDVDGTLVDSTIVHYYAFFRRRDMRPLVAAIWHVAFLAKCVGFILIDKINRTWFNRVFYRGYGGLPAARTKALAAECYEKVIRPRRFAEGASCIDGHLREGRRVVLVTGSIDFLIAPLAQALSADDVIAPALVERDGVFTGELDGPPVGEAEKARRVSRFAEEHGIDLAGSYAYGDSIADAPMLERVGHPVAVNPDGKLSAMARQRGWRIETWTRTGVGGAQGA